MEKNNFLFPYLSESDDSRETKVIFFVTKYLLDCIIYCMTFLIHGMQSGLFYQEEA